MKVNKASKGLDMVREIEQLRVDNQKLTEAAKAAASLIRGSGFTESTKALVLLTEAIGGVEEVEKK